MLFEKVSENSPPNSHRLQLRPFGHFGLGTAAKEAIDEGELYISVPEKLFLGPRTMPLNSPMAKACDAANVNEMERTVIFLLSERHNPQSFWAPCVFSRRPFLKNAAFAAAP